MPKQSSDESENPRSEPGDKELFPRTWDLENGEMTNLQILTAIKNGKL